MSQEENNGSPGGPTRTFLLIEPSEYDLIILVLRRLFLCLLLLFLMGLGALAMWMDTDRRYSGFFLALIAFSGTLAVVRRGTHLHDGENIFGDDDDMIHNYLNSPNESPKHSNATAYRHHQGHPRGPPPSFSEEDPEQGSSSHDPMGGVHHHHAGSSSGHHHHHLHSNPGTTGHTSSDCSMNGQSSASGWLPPPPPPPYHMACPEPPPAYFDIVTVDLMGHSSGADLGASTTTTTTVAVEGSAGTPQSISGQQTIQQQYLHDGAHLAGPSCNGSVVNSGSCRLEDTSSSASIGPHYHYQQHHQPQQTFQQHSTPLQSQGFTGSPVTSVSTRANTATTGHNDTSASVDSVACVDQRTRSSAVHTDASSEIPATSILSEETGTTVMTSSSQQQLVADSIGGCGERC